MMGKQYGSIEKVVRPAKKTAAKKAALRA